jgi:Lsr2
VAQKVQVLLTDDLDGSTAQETIRFKLDGTDYEIDLNKKNAKSLRDALGKYTAAARRTGPAARSASNGRRSRNSTTGRDVNPRAVREWAAKNNIPVSARGRIPQDLLAQFKAAGGR